MNTLVKRNNLLFSGLPMFDDFIVKEMFVPKQTENIFYPAVNIRETEQAFELELVAPGLEKENFKVELENQELIISAKKEGSSETSEGIYKRRDYIFSEFKRSFTLPESVVDTESISAKYLNGILHVQIPKVEKVIPQTRKIVIE